MQCSLHMKASRGVYLFHLLIALVITANNNYHITCEAASVTVGSARYNLIPRDDTRKTQATVDTSSPSSTTESPMLISFDGDVNAIKELALAKANNTPRPPNTFSCDNETTSHLEIVNWIYSIETVSNANVATVYGEVQEITIDVVAPKTLTCYNNQSAFAHIIAMDSAIPGHEISTKQTCKPVLDPTNNCTVIIGRMRMFLSNKTTVQEATTLVLKHVQEAYDDPTFVDMVNSGLVDITFLDAEDGSSGENAPPPIKDDNDAGNGNEEVPRESDSRLGLSSLLFVSIGSAALFVFVGSVYFWRRGRQNDEDDGIHGSSASRLANLTINDAATHEQDDKESNNLNRPASPYSEMVSNSYRLDRLQEMSILSSSNMSPVYEMEGQETDNDTVGGSASILISEGGYTTDAGGTEEGDSTMFESTTVGGSKYSSSQSTPNVLGARPFPGTIGNIDMEEISDSDLDTSGEMSPVKMYVGNALMTSTQQKLLVLPTGRDLMDEENDDHDDSLLFGSPSPAPHTLSSTDVVEHDNNNTVPHTLSAPTDEAGDGNSSTRSSTVGDIESGVGSMSHTSPMSQNTAPSLPSF